MVEHKIEKALKNKPKDKKQLIISITVIVAVIITFAIFMTFDFAKKPQEEPKESLTSEQRQALLEETMRNSSTTSSEERLELLKESRDSESLTREERMNLLMQDQ